MPDARPVAGGTTRYVLDASTRLTADGQALIGGSPLRVLRLGPRGRAVVRELRAGRWADHRRTAATSTTATTSASGRSDGGRSDGGQRLVRRLVEIGAVHPEPAARPVRPGEVTVVIPTWNSDRELQRTLAALRATASEAELVVVDDGGTTPDATARRARGCGAVVLRHERNRGPAAARNTGLAAATTPLVAFLDAGCEPRTGWLGLMAAQLDITGAAIVAPRIGGAAAPNRSLLARYEGARSPLDRGPTPGPVAARTRIPFVPSTCLLARTAALTAVGGFDESLRVGEDVDLVWRAAEAGQVVRYEPRAVVAHNHRRSVSALLRQRFAYGTSAAALHRRHPGSVSPLGVSGWSLAVWGALAAGRPALGLTLAAGTTAALARRLRSLDRPVWEAVHLAGPGHLAAGGALAEAMVRAWWPLTLLAASASRRARRAAVAAVVLPALAEWRRRRPGVDPLRWLLLRLADDVAYGAGVWEGCRREATVGPLVPTVANWPGKRPAVTGPRRTAAVVLAGGRARRLHGADKPGLVVGGSALLSRVLAATRDCDPQVVVGPARPELAPAGTAPRFVADAVAGGGPAAALPAGLAALGAPLPEHVLVLAADLPFLTRAALASLEQELERRAELDGVVAADDEGRPQWLCGVWRTERLVAHVAARHPGAGSSLSELFAGLHVGRRRPATQDQGPDPWFDCDTPEDLARSRLHSEHPPAAREQGK